MSSTATETSLELVVYTHDAGALTTNAKAILETVKSKLLGYKPENYNEDNIAVAKQDKADLNNAAKKLNAARIKLEKDHMLSLKEGIDLINKAVGEIKKASIAIDEIVKTVEAQEKENKKKRILEFFNSLGTELVSFDQVFTLDMLNKTAKIKDIETTIQAKIEKVKTDLVVLDRIGEPEARVFYLSTLNLESALRKADEIKANRERLAKIDNKPIPQTPAPVVTPAAAPTMPAVQVMVSGSSLYIRTIRVSCTKAQLQALSNFLNEQAIEYEKVQS